MPISVPKIKTELRVADPWFKFYPSDWLGGTRGLTAEETGVYITMIAMMYEAGGGLPHNHLSCPAMRLP